MKNPINKSFKLVFFTQIADLIILNLFYFFFCLINAWWFQDPVLMKNQGIYWLVGNITYLISANLIIITLYDRMVRPEKVIGSGGRVIALQLLLFLASLSLFHIPDTPFLILVLFYIPYFVLYTAERLLIHRIIRNARYEGRGMNHVILIGDGIAIKNIADVMNDRWNGYHLDGMFTDNEVRYPDITFLGDTDNVIPYLNEHNIDEVYCTLLPDMKEKTDAIMNFCEKNVIHLYNVPLLSCTKGKLLNIKRLGDIFVIGLRSEPLNEMRNRFLKRTLDLTVSTLFLFIVYPFVYLIVATIIKLTSPGPVYFKQERTGINGRNFMLYKFRSMQVNEDSDTVQAIKGDARVTKFGKFLRHSNIDELPQFINVWKNDMSLVGPRPHMLKHTEFYSERIGNYMVRHFVKPGITGWAQVHGFRGETKDIVEMENRVNCDIWYLENWSFWLDVVILIKTVINMFQGEKKAY